MEEVKGCEQPVSDTEKIYSFLSYLLFFGILIYLQKRDSDYVQFHAKQGMVLFALSFINFILMVIPVLGWLLVPFLNIAVLVLFIMGANNALSGAMKQLPLIGQFADVIK